MKKSISAFVASCLMSGAVLAQTNFQLYGIVDSGISWNDDGNNKVISLDDGYLSASRFGFRGTENLGQGLSSHFVLEQAFNTDTGAPANPQAQFSRLAYVGVASQLGTVRMGRQNAPLKEALDAVDPYGGAGLLATFATFNYLPGSISTGGFNGGWPARLSNQITYISPKVSNFYGEIAYNFGESIGDIHANQQYGMQIGYRNGPLNLQFGYHRSYVDEPTNESNAKIIFVGGTYSFPSIKLHAGYGDSRNKLDQLSDLSIRVNNYLIGTTITFGASSLIASLTRNDIKAASDTSTTQLGLAYLYDFSARTTLYTQYAHSRNGVFSDFKVSDPGQDGKQFVIGIRHKF